MYSLKMYNGVEIPAIILGPGGPARAKGLPFIADTSIFSKAWRKFVTGPIVIRKFVNAVGSGLTAGFRGLDFSASYGNAEWIADAMRKSGVKRKDVFLTGRISNGIQFRGERAVEELIKRLLDEYQTDYLDLLQFHWPVTGFFENTWKVICKAYERGKARSIGVANCHRHHIEALMNVGLKPMVNQFEVHPLFTQKELIKYNQDIGIVVESYTPIARMDMRLYKFPALKKIATRHGKSAVQIVLRWHVQQSLVPVVRSTNHERQMENLDIFDFELAPEEMRIIDGFNINSRLRFDPDNCDFTVL